MTIQNDFLPIATASNANVISQPEFAALSAVLQGGFSSGIAKSSQINKVLRQSSIMSAVLAAFIVDKAGVPAIDDGTVATLQAGISKAVTAIAQSSQSGVVGSARAGRMSVPAASSSAVYTADELIVASTLGGAQFRLSNLNLTVNLASTGAGGMDTGAAPASGFVALYAIYNPTTQTSALLAVNATSAAVGNVYGGANMPAGYTASALVSVWRTNASGQLTPGHQVDRRVFFPYVQVLSNGSATSLTAFSLSSVIPKNARTWAGWASINGISNASLVSQINVAAATLGTGQIVSSTPGNAASLPTATSFMDMPLITPQTALYMVMNYGSGDAVMATGYTF